MNVPDELIERAVDIVREAVELTQREEQGSPDFDAADWERIDDARADIVYRLSLVALTTQGEGIR